MSLVLRVACPDDAAPCGDICYRAFTTISEAHNFPPDFPGPEVAVGLLAMLVSHPGIYGVVAELDGRIVGSNFIDERSTIPGIGPITVDPAVQNRSTGRRLMEHVLERAASRGAPGVRLVQTAFHNRSLSLYTKLGFDAREPLSVMQGPALGIRIPGHVVRAATEADVPGCNTLCRRVHGHDRAGEVADARGQGGLHVVEHDGRISGYTTGLDFFGHAVAETNEDLRALIGAAPAFGGPGFLLPTRNGELFRWCLAHGLRVVEPMTLMSIGLYNEPAGAFLPSILY